MSDTRVEDSWWLAADGKWYPPRNTPRPPKVGPNPSGWTTAVIVTLASVVLTFLTSAGSLVISMQTADKQTKLQDKIATETLSAAAPRTEVSFDSATLDAADQTLTLVVTIQEVGQVTVGYGCRISDDEAISEKPAPAQAEQTSGGLKLLSGDTDAGISLTVSKPVTVTLAYQRHADGYISISVAAICGDQYSTSKALTVQVLSVNGAINPKAIVHFNQ